MKHQSGQQQDPKQGPQLSPMRVLSAKSVKRGFRSSLNSSVSLQKPAKNATKIVSIEVLPSSVRCWIRRFVEVRFLDGIASTLDIQRSCDES
jgi:hypothetical protein